MKKLFGKRGIALLTTLALVVSMVAMLGGLTASAEYSPKRTMSITAGGTQIEGKILMYQTAEILGANKDIVIKGYYKVDGYVAKNDTDHNVQIAPGATGAASVKADCDWTPFEATWNTGETGVYHVLKFGFWYAQGTMSLADIVIEDTEGNVLYDFATDKDLPAGDIAGGEQYGFWYFGYYGEKSEFSGKIDAAVETGYQPKRTMSLTATVDSLDAGAFQAAFMLAKAGEYFGYSTEYTVKGYYKVADFVSVDASSKATLGAAGVEQVAEWTAFETTYTSKESGEAWSDYGFWNAGGTLYLADIVLEKDGVVVYDMATDVNLVAGEYTTAQSFGIWYLGKWGAGTGSFKFVIDEAVEAEDPCANGHKYVGGVCERCNEKKVYPVIEGDTTYEPKRVMSVETWGGKNGATGTAIEGKFLLTRGYFPGHSVAVLKGYYKIENYVDAVNGSGNCVQLGEGSRISPDHNPTVIGNTDGWVYFEIPFRPKSEDNTDWEGCTKFGFWYTHGKLSLADITVESTTGEVLYDMCYDETLPTGTHSGTEWLEKNDAGELVSGGIQTDRWYIGAYLYDDWADVEFVVTEALEKPVTPPAQTGDVNMIVVVALGAMAAMTLAVVTLNKKKFSV